MAANEWASLPDKEIKALVARVQKAKGADAKMAAIEEVAGHEGRHALLWHLVRKGALDGADEPELWEELNRGDDHASSADVFAVVSRITPEALKRCPTIDFIKGWPIVIDQLAAVAYSKDPSPWERGKLKLPPSFHDGFAILRVRLERAPKPMEAKRLLRVLAYTHARGGLYRCFWMMNNGALEWTEIYTGRLPNDAFYRFIHRFGTTLEWQKALREAFLEQDERDLEFDPMIDAIRSVSREDAVKLLKRLRLGDAWVRDVYRFLAEIRHNSSDDLMWMARYLAAEHEVYAEICAVALLLTLKRHRVPAKTKAAPFIKFKSYDTTPGEHLLDGIEELTEALETLSEDMRRRLIGGQMGQKDDPMRSIPALKALPETDLLEQAISVIESVADKSFSAMNIAAYGLARLGAGHLEWLGRRIDEATEPALRETLVRAMLYILRDLSEKGRSWDPALDRYITFHGWEDKDRPDDHYAHDMRPALLAIMKALPEERAEAVLVREIDPAKRSFTRPFEGLAAHPTPAALDHAFRVLVEARGRISQPLEDFLAKGIAALGEAAVPYVKRAIEASGRDKALLEHFEAALGKAALATG